MESKQENFGENNPKEIQSVSEEITSLIKTMGIVNNECNETKIIKCSGKYKSGANIGCECRYYARFIYKNGYYCSLHLPYPQEGKIGTCSSILNSGPNQGNKCNRNAFYRFNGIEYCKSHIKTIGSNIRITQIS